MPSRRSWIVCEASGRWAAALRIALLRRASGRRQPNTHNRILEVRSITEVDSLTSQFPNSIAFIETTSVNLPEVLQLAARSKTPRIPILALLGESLASGDRQRPELNIKIQTATPPAHKHTARDLLNEAGVLAVVTAPRKLVEILPLAEKIFSATSQAAGPNQRDSSLQDWAWAQLPWQDA